MKNPSDCSACGGTGQVDTGGFTPWGAPIVTNCVECNNVCRRCGGDGVLYSSWELNTNGRPLEVSCPDCRKPRELQNREPVVKSECGVCGILLLSTATRCPYCGPEEAV